MENKNIFAKFTLAIAALLLTQICHGAEISGFRDNVERINDNKGIELLLFKKMTDENMEYFSVRNMTELTITDISGNIVYMDMRGNRI